MLKSAKNIHEFQLATDVFANRAAELRKSAHWFLHLWQKTYSPKYLEYWDEIDKARKLNLRDWRRCNAAGFNR